MTWYKQLCIFGIIGLMIIMTIYQLLTKENNKFIESDLGDPSDLGNVDDVNDVDPLCINLPKPKALNLTKGIAYDAWPFPDYNPSKANKYGWSFGSDISSNHMQIAWGQLFKDKQGRNDLKRIKSMGFNAVKLYNYADKFQHDEFLNYALSLDLSVAVPISEWNFQDDPNNNYDGGYPHLDKDEILKNLIISFTGFCKIDYHPAINIILFSNEPDIDENNGKIKNENAATRVLSVIDKYIKLERTILPLGNAKKLPIGIPISSIEQNNKPPGIQFYDDFIIAINKFPETKDEILERYVICMNVFAKAVNKWIPDIQNKLKLNFNINFPGLLTEIGYSRFNKKVPTTEFTQALEWSFSGKNNMLGAFIFQFADKSWKIQPPSSEGQFGLFLQQTQSVNTSVNFQKWDFNQKTFDFFKEHGVSMDNITVKFNNLEFSTNWDLVKPYLS